MDQRFKQFEKLISRVLVSKINNIFSQYEDCPTRIIKVVVLEPKKHVLDPSISEFILEQVKVAFIYNNKPYGYNGIAAQINYLTLGLSSYIFTNTIVLYIKHKFGKELEVEGVFESSGYRRSESEAWEIIEYNLDKNYTKKGD